MRFISTAAAIALAATVAFASDTASAKTAGSANAGGADAQTKQEEYIVPNAPILSPTNIITVRAIGMGAVNEGKYSRAQEMAMAKRAAIIDGYRQLGEKLHGIRINARDTVKDSALVHSEIRTELYSVVRGAEIVETIWENGLCQVEMEVKLDGRRWYKVLAGN
ncbi:hypothetical protein FACS1894103_2580 [Campylobacterota bacterium]|nr:hypothetical protein FACS1894103_2580 [Campylobacterota bacterium]